MTTEQVLNFHVPKVFKFRMPLTVASALNRDVFDSLGRTCALAGPNKRAQLP